MLDIAGLSPGIGNVPDLLNAVIYVAEGDLANAALSGISAIPLVGIFSTTTKIVKTNVKSKKVAKGAGGASDINFKGLLKGEEIELPNVSTKKILYTKRIPFECRQLRNVFNSKARSNFLKFFSVITRIA